MEQGLDNQGAIERVEVVDYDPLWPSHFAAELDTLANVTPAFIDLEHIGSTAVPHQRAKPIIDMMASVRNLSDANRMIPQLARSGYALTETGMKERLFLRKPAAKPRPGFHLHIVTKDTWDGRKERLMRDYLRTHPRAVAAYGQLKVELAGTFSEDSLSYTRAKTEFIQRLVDDACDERGLPRMDVWND